MLALVGGLTAVGLVLRLRGLGQGLWGDELIARADVSHSFGGMLHEVATGIENSPPLYFVLAWASDKLGSDPSLIRLPSLILGTATIPLVALVGIRTVGRGAAVVAAVVVALGPFAIFYSVEARPYATLAFASILSVQVLLIALERRRTAWWAVYGLTLAAVLYSHYTGAFVVAGQLGWALWIERRSPRGPLVAGACAAVAFAPWLPYVKAEQLSVYSQVAKILGLTKADAAVTWLAGLPFFKPSEVPGTPVLLVLAGALVLAIAGALVAGSWRPRRPERVALIALLAVATPVGVLVYSFAADDLFVFPRNLIASLPFAALLVGWVLTRPPPRFAVPAVALTACALAVAAASSQLDDHSRPDFPQLASHVDAVAGPRDAVVYATDPLEARALATYLEPYYDHPRPVVAEPDPSDWSDHLRSGRVVVVSAWPPGATAGPLLPGHGLTEVQDRYYDGVQTLAAAVYRRDPVHGPHSYSVRGDRLVPAGGAPLPIRSKGVDGVIQAFAPRAGGRFLYTGWANRADEPVDKVVVLAGDRVLFADAPYLKRPDVAGDDPDGGRALGFEFTPSVALLRSTGQPTAYAIAGGVAYRLGHFCDPKVEQPVPCTP
jgi:Dolichyl-phosphate-mannose-protein mannosyltransferase